MATDIFNREATIGEPFNSDDVALIFSGGGGESMVVQQFTASYGQEVTRIWEIGSKRSYFIQGRQSGEANMQRIIGPTPIASEFLSRFGDTCRIAENNMTVITRGICELGARPSALSLNGCVITNVGYAIQAQDTVVREEVRLLVANVSN